jgi:ATP:corrinoid adenosyltransferase
MEQATDERYKDKAALRQASYLRKKEAATEEKGLIKHPYKAGIKAQRGVEF